MAEETAQKVIKVAISIPTEGHTQAEAYDNHLLHAFRLGAWESEMKLTNRPIAYEFYWFSAGRLFTAMAREKLVQEALKENVDYMVMYDDDMLLPPDMAKRMLLDVEEHPEIDILAPLAFMRNPPHFAVIYNTEKGYDQIRHQDYTINNFVKHYPKDTLIECDAVGFGAVLIKMDIVRKMTSPYFFSTTGTGEDIYFCIKAKDDVKARIFMDTRIKLGHLSHPQIIDEDYFEHWIKSNNYDLGEEIINKYNDKNR